MVAVILIEAGMPALDAVAFIRSRRRGALNSLQLQWLVDTYKRRAKKPALFFGKRSNSPDKGEHQGFFAKLGRMIVRSVSAPGHISSPQPSTSH